jgi:hypothetical protein
MLTTSTNENDEVMEMSETTIEKFDQEYLETWTATDPDARRAAIERVWAPEGRMFVGPPAGATLEGHDQIAAFVGQVNAENIVGKGLEFVYDARQEAGDSLMLRWSMLTPDGETVGRGMEVLYRDGGGKVTAAYVYLGVD